VKFLVVAVFYVLFGTAVGKCIRRRRR